MAEVTDDVQEKLAKHLSYQRNFNHGDWDKMGEPERNVYRDQADGFLAIVRQSVIATPAEVAAPETLAARVACQRKGTEIAEAYAPVGRMPYEGDFVSDLSAEIANALLDLDQDLRMENADLKRFLIGVLSVSGPVTLHKEVLEELGGQKWSLVRVRDKIDGGLYLEAAME